MRSGRSRPFADINSPKWALGTTASDIHVEEPPQDATQRADEQWCNPKWKWADKLNEKHHHYRCKEAILFVKTSCQHDEKERKYEKCT